MSESGASVGGMRGVIVFCAIALGACFNVTSPDGPPPHVDPPVIACTVPTESDASCSTPEASTEDAAAVLVTGCDAGPPVQQYDQCTLPPSVCADSHWAAYFDDGTCVKGTCELVTKYHYCETGCSHGACIFHGSTLAGRGF